MLKYFALLLLLCIVSLMEAQSNFYDITKIQKIELQFSQSNWDYILDTNKSGNDQYTLAQYIKVNGVQMDSVGVKYKGSSSYDSTFKKNPLHIKLDKFKSNSYLGINDIKLANGYSDPSMIREALAYSLLNKYMHSPRSNFAMVFINGLYIGIYTNDEQVSKTFSSEHFYSDASNPMFKCSQVIASPYAKSSLQYISNDSNDYMPRYEMESKVGWKDFIRLCDSVTNFQSKIPANIDIDRFLWMFAFNNVLINMDSYCGAFSQNYYVFKDNTNHYNPIVWDLNMSFGAFPYVGSQGGGLGTLNVTQMQNLTALLHAADADWPVMNYLLSDASYKKRYQAHVRTILNENFVNAGYEALAAQMQALVDSAVKADNNKFFTYTQFQNGMTGNVIFGSRTIPGIKTLMDARKTYLLASADLAGTQPAITNVITSVTNPVIGNTFTIKANILNAITVKAFYRFSQAQKFTAVSMVDDGAHNDGAANDKVFGANVFMTSGICEYYIYAESADAAMLSPQRAEHEFYTVSSAATKVNKGDVAINEFMADNVAAVKDIAGEFDDWAELYNNTANTVDLTGWFLTDDFTNKTKWRFPNGTSIAPDGYLIVWCDNQTTQAGIHSTIKLNNSGENIMLCQADTSIVDSITFGVQKTDTSFARIPNGTGPFQFRLNTYNIRNDTAIVGIHQKVIIPNNCTVYPNPTSGIINIVMNNDFKVFVYDLSGKEILVSSSKTIDMSRFENGMYVLKIITEQGMVEMVKVELFK